MTYLQLELSSKCRIKVQVMEKMPLLGMALDIGLHSYCKVSPLICIFGPFILHVSVSDNEIGSAFLTCCSVGVIWVG